MVEHALPAPEPMHLAMIGTRGVPAAYGGFETACHGDNSRVAGRANYSSDTSGQREDTSEA